MVVHRVYGPGVILQLDEKILHGKTSQYYVLQVRDLTLWVPVNRTEKLPMRSLTPVEDFKQLFRILASKGEPLSNERFERKTELDEKMKKGTLDSICHVIRDLTNYKKINKMNESDQTILGNARSLLLNEWSLVFSIPFHQAERELTAMLGGK
jgi:RNA polymerase-interacting CarD/CdnL/TRCF family regulator